MPWGSSDPTNQTNDSHSGGAAYENGDYDDRTGERRHSTPLDPLAGRGESRLRSQRSPNSTK